MKSFIAIISLLFGASVAKAQVDSCTSFSFCYVYIHPSTSTCKWVYHCSTNPNSGDFPPDIPTKWEPGSTIHYSTNNLSQGCVNAAALDNCIDDAFCLWERQCGSDNTIFAERDAWDPTDGNQIPIEVQPNNEQLSASTHEFGETVDDRKSYVAITHVERFCNGALGPSNPSLTINQPLDLATFIDINATSDYAAAFTDVYPCPPSGCSTNRPKIDICKAVTHEIGHLLGLMHTLPSYYESHQPPPIPDMPDCGSHDPHMSDLMDTSLQNQPCNGTPPALSTYDKCMYQKLYCPQDTRAQKGGAQPQSTSCSISDIVAGAFEPNFDPALMVFPNPSTGMLTIQYNLDQIGAVALRVYNALGELAFGFNYREEPGIASHIINLSQLPSGHYVVRISSTDMRASRVIAIDR